MSQVLKPKKGYKKVKWLFGKEIEIPEEWKLAKIESIADKLLSGGTPSTSVSEYWDGDIAWTKGATLTTHHTTKGERLISKTALNNSSTSIIPKDNLLVVSRVSIGNISINKIDIAINQDITAIIPNKSLCLTEFLYWSLFDSIGILVSFSQGTTIQGFTRKDLSNHRIFLPSLPEQQKILSFLSNIDNLIINTQKIIEQTKSTKQGLMQKLMIKGIGHKKFKKVIFGRYFINYSIPIDWKIIKLNKIFNIKNGVNKEKSFFGKGTPIVNVLDVYGNSGLISNQIKGKVTLSENEIISFKLKKGDVVFTRTSETIEDIGTSSVILDDVEKTTFSGFLLRAQPKTEDFEINFKIFCFSSNIIRRQIISTATKTSRALTTKNYLSNVVIPIPPLPEQQQIATILSNVDSQIQSQVQYKEKLERLKKSLMQKLLTGEVRVTV